MHYLIDGYNMLFRLMKDHYSLKDQRESIICDLNKKISLVKLNTSIIFDSAFQIGESSRSHYDCLEIIFSAHGESADDYILDEILNASHPSQKTVVTSDKKLAWHIRHASAHTESIEGFILWLNRCYKNKLKTTLKENLKAPKIFLPSATLSQITDTEITDDNLHDYYAQVFEIEWQQISQQEELKKIERFKLKKNLSRQPRPIYDPFALPKMNEEKTANETERWLKIFENKLKDSF